MNSFANIADQFFTIGVPLGVVVISWIGVLLTAFTLPGIWLALLAAGLAQWWSLSGPPMTDGSSPVPMFSWWTLGACVVLALLAELVEFIASALGAHSAGGSKRAAVASMVGALIGALVGTFALPVPIVGTIVGGAVGAGAAALLAEKHLGERTWKHSAKVGGGAAIGRLVATLAKVGFAAVIALILSIAAFI
jgi:uncharacterized protein